MGILKNKNNNKITEMDYKVVNNIKTLALDMISNAGSGHSGVVLSAGNIIYDIYARHLVFNKNESNWINRDRFVLSGGHASALLYSTLYMCGFLEIEDLKNFRKIGSRTPGHPEYGVTPGVDVSTGPLGEGFANAVGMAIAERHLNEKLKYNKKNSLIDHYIYVLCGDGDLMEGVSYEAASIAGNLKLSKLIVLYDSNNCTSDSRTDYTFKENVLDRFKSMNWNTVLVNDDILEIDNAIEIAKKSDKPTIIEVKTILGKGLKEEGNAICHSKVLTVDEISKIKNKFDIRDIPYSVSQDNYEYFNKLIDERCDGKIKEYDKLINKYSDIFNIFNKKINVKDIDFDGLGAQREISNKILSKIVTKNNLIIGGSCDLSFSTGTKIDVDDFTSDNYGGQNILYGIREHAMGAIMNGIALSGIKTYGSTMLSFSDFLKPSLRMAALMKLPVIYIFSHDSILVGEDGPTHQPVEQLVSLRSIPNVTVFRPYDVNEIIGAYKCALDNNSGPSVIIISKNKVESSCLTRIKGVENGAYLVKENPLSTGILAASGYELKMALNIAERLEKENIYINVVSVPSIEMFEKMDEKYKESIFPVTMKKAVLEFSSSYSWYKYVYGDKYLFTVDNFGLSGDKDDVLKYFSLDEDTVYEKIKEILK